VTTTRSFVKDVVGRAAFQVLSVVKGLVVLPLVARAYGASGYGIWTQISITVALAAPLVSLRLNEAVVRYLSGIEPGTRRGRAFFTTIIVTWGLSVVLLIVGVLTVRGVSVAMFDDPGLTRYAFLALGMLVVSVSYSMATAYYRATSRISVNTFLNTIETLAVLAAVFGIAGWMKGSLDVVLLALIGIDVVLSAGCLIDIARREGGFGLSREWIGKFLRYSLPLIPTVALYWVVSSSDRFVIVHFRGLDQAGVYSAVYRATQIIKILVHPLAFVLLPTMAALWEKRREEVALGFLSKALQWYLFAAIPAVAGLAAIGSPLVRLLGGGGDFAVSTGLVVLLAAAELFVGVYQLWVYVLYVKERNPILILFFAVAATLNLGGNLLLVPRIGILGAAWTTFLAYAVQAALVVSYARRLVDVRFPVSIVLRMCVAAGGVYLAAWAVPGTGWGDLVVRIVAGIGAYAFLAFALRIVRRDDLAPLVEWMRRRGGRS